MRIGIVAPPWLPVPPERYGGTEAVVDVLARGLVAAGHEVVLVTTGESTCPVDKRFFFDQCVGFTPTSPVDLVRHTLFAYEELRAFDVIHDHTTVGPLVAQPAPGVSVVSTNHNAFDLATLDLYRRVSRRSSVVAISDHHATTAVGVPIAAVIRHGLNLSQYPPGVGDGGYAAFLGRMDPAKGVKEAILAARAAGVPLRIAAKMREAPETEYFRSTIEPLLGGAIEYIGEVGHTDKVALLGGAIALLNPIQWNEPFGLAMIEAMACGSPVVATPRGSVPEIVEHQTTGLICSNHEELVAALQRVGELDRNACRRSVESRFSAARMVEEHVNLYRRLTTHGHTMDRDRRSASHLVDFGATRMHAPGQPALNAHSSVTKGSRRAS